ncbi:hypothetical protein, partial [Paenibacillus alginolyticus]
MQTIDSNQNVKYFLDEHTGQVTISGQLATFRDIAFLSYALIQRGEAERVLPVLRLMNSDQFKGKLALTDAALRIWAFGEYLKVTEDQDFKLEIEGIIEDTTLLLDSNWQKPQPHWLQHGNEGIYLSHLAMYFSAVQANIQNGVGERGVRLLKAIRELVFASFIKEGRVISELGDTAIHGDILTAAIPFGMLGIEDRILIEALYKLEETLVSKGVRFKAGDTFYGGCERSDLTCLLAWYYAKKGDTVRAKELLTHVESLRKENAKLYEVEASTAKEPLLLAYWCEHAGEPPVSTWGGVLLELAQAALISSDVRSESLDSVTLVHQPTGYDDPYVILPYERFPRHPEAGDSVLVRLLTQPFQASQVVTVQAAVNGIPAAEAVTAVMKVTDGGEKVWEAQLGPYLTGDEVSYAFALQSGSKSLSSATYSFQVRAWTALERVHELCEKTDGFVVELGYGAEATRTAQLSFRSDESGAIKLTFAADGERLQGAPAQRAALA